MRLLAVALAALVLAPVAGAWTRLTPATLPNISEPVAFRTASGAELVAYSDYNSSIFLIRGRSAPRALVSGWIQIGAPQLTQQPNGTLLLYFTGTSPGFAQQGTLFTSSGDGGASWSAPQLTGVSSLGDVRGAAVRPDGTPLFSQDGTGFVNVTQSGVTHNVFPYCCGYFETLGVDSTGLAELAFYSNASGREGFIYQALDASGGASGAALNLSGGARVAPRGTDRIPLATDKAGNTFVAWMPGYPGPTALRVTTLRGGSRIRTATVTRLAGPVFPHMALAVDAQNRVWAVWTSGSPTALHAARSRTGGRSFGATVTSRLPAGYNAYQLTALATGSGLDAFLNLGATAKNSLWTQHLLPGLTVVAHTTGVRVSDNGFPVAGATVRGGGRAAKTSAKGVARIRLRRGTPIVVTKAGYASASAIVR